MKKGILNSTDIVVSKGLEYVKNEEFHTIFIPGNPVSEIEMSEISN